MVGGRRNLTRAVPGSALLLGLALALAAALILPATALATARPAVTSISPRQGGAAGGTVVTVRGKHFTASGKSLVKAVKFGKVAGTKIRVQSSTSLTVHAPKGRGTVNVYVVTKGGTSAGVKADRYVYKSVPPVITSLSPATGSTLGGTTVTVNGRGFSNATAVMFGDVAAATFTVSSDAVIVVTAPHADIGFVDVTVATPLGTSAIVPADRFTYYTPATVAGVSPKVGLAGDSVTINGTVLAAATVVKFGTAVAAILSKQSTKIVARVPAGTDTVDVTVTTPAGTTATSTADQFTYKPIVTAVSPGSGPATGGTSVTITGTSFSGATAVGFGTTIGTTTVTPDSVSATSITATAPAGTGAADITVTTPAGSSAVSAADQFDYLPVVSGVSPDNGPHSGGTSVTISGSGLSGVTAVKFGTTSVVPASVSDTSIDVTAPAGTGTVDVTVTTPTGTSAPVAADRYTFNASPAVTAVSPDNGSEAGGASLIISGSGFSGATAVKFGTIAASFSVTSATEISATSPAGTGTVDVSVTTPNGTSSVVSADQFTYNPAPAVTGLSPDSGPEAGATPEAISGSGFGGATAVYFGSTSVAFTVNSNSSISATSPAGTGTVDVTVVTPNGTSATTAADQYTYNAPPAVTGLTPSDGPEDGGTAVTIHGTGFSGATAVYFGSAPVAPDSVSASSITATSPAGTGTVDVTVVTPNGTSATTAADQYTYDAPPTVDAVSPDTGLEAGGDSVTITGSGFAGATAVDFGGVATGDFQVISDSSITATTPAGTGTVDVHVTAAGGTSSDSASDQYTYLPPP
jgi:hypothetical protein